MKIYLENILLKLLVLIKLNFKKISNLHVTQLRAL